MLLQFRYISYFLPSSFILIFVVLLVTFYIPNIEFLSDLKNKCLIVRLKLKIF